MKVKTMLTLLMILLISSACESVSLPQTLELETGEARTVTASPREQQDDASSESQPSAEPAVAGAPGLGDPIYPLAGNGGYDVAHYTLTLDVNPEENHIEGTAEIMATALQNLSALNFDFHALEVDSVTVNGQPATYSRDGDEMTVTPAQTLLASTTFAVRISYAGTPETIVDQSIPIALGWQRQTGGTFVVAEPIAAKNWFPANDHPSDKATYTFAVTLPASYVVAANGVLASATTEEDKSHYVWEMRMPMASYLATIHIGDYELESFKEDGKVPIRNYYPTGTVDTVRAKFDVTTDMMAYVEGVIAPYPFEEYGVVLLNDPTGWALETQSLSTFGAGGPWDQTVVMHELAHSWFGNAISPATWQDVWLNEGFATYFEALWLDHIGHTDIDERMNNIYLIIRNDEVGPPATPAIEDLFGQSTYLRGAAALHALRQEVGDETFFDILREYFQLFQNQSASTADFLAVVAELGGLEAESVLYEWLYTEAVPERE